MQVTFVMNGLSVLADRLSQLAATLPDELAPANEAIRQEALIAIDEYYPAGFTSRFETEVDTVPDALASVVVHSTDPLALWYEFGTAAHTITARNASALAFEWRGEKVFFNSVNNPGEQARHHETDVATAMAAVAFEEWSAIIDALLATAFTTD